MIDFLYTAGQVLCMIGLGYGAYLCLTFGRGEPPTKSKAHYDPLTMHEWRNTDEDAEPLRHRIIW